MSLNCSSTNKQIGAGQICIISTDNLCPRLSIYDDSPDSPLTSFTKIKGTIVWIGMYKVIQSGLSPFSLDYVEFSRTRKTEVDCRATIIAEKNGIFSPADGFHRYGANRVLF